MWNPRSYYMRKLQKNERKEILNFNPGSFTQFLVLIDAKRRSQKQNK